jgi:O-antigen/teichoic acid export membrane protein
MATSERTEQASEASLSRVGRNTGILFVTQLTTWVIGALVMATVPRIIGPTAVGELAVAGSLWAIAGVFITFGTGTVITLGAANEPEAAGRMVGPALRLQLTMSIVAVVILTSFAVLAGYSSTTVSLVVFLGLSTFVGTVWSIGYSAMVGMEKMTTIARASIISRIAGAAITLALVITTRHVFAAAVTGLATFLVSIPMLMRPFSKAVPVSYRSTWPQTIALARRGVPYLVAGLALIVYQQVDTLTMSLLVDEQHIGWYIAADALFATLLFAPTLFTTALLPTLTREHGQDPDRALRTLGRSFDLLVVIAVPVSLLAVVGAKPITELLYGDQFSGSAPVLAVFGVVLAFTFFSVLFGTYAVASGQQVFWNKVMIAAIVASIALDIILVPWAAREFDNGALGGAIAFVITEAGMVAAAFWLLAPTLSTAPRAMRVVKCLVGGAALVGVALVLRNQPFLLTAVGGAAAYLVTVMALRVLGPDELSLMKAIISRRGTTPSSAPWPPPWPPPAHHPVPTIQPSDR